MITVDKQYTDNPFVDNLIYYAKILALNSVIKDEELAVANETKESMQANGTYIACVEKRASYEMFKTIPADVLSKYIPQTSNLELYATSDAALVTYLNSLGAAEGSETLSRLNKYARIVYIDHFHIMSQYVESLGDKWEEDNNELYLACVNGTAYFESFFYIIPEETRRRIILEYVTTYDGYSLEELASSLEKFTQYFNDRSDPHAYNELFNINRAMQTVFASHYETIVDHRYTLKIYKNNWYDYNMNINLYNACLSEDAKWYDIYDCVPNDDRVVLLNKYIDKGLIAENEFDINKDNVKLYINSLSEAVASEINSSLSRDFRTAYIENYNMFVNNDVYRKCIDGLYGYFALKPYMPLETLKMILASEIPEFTNHEVYAAKKGLLNSYLNTLNSEEANRIKTSIAKDMEEYYVKNFKEPNNYYRTYVGLPPLINGVEYEDTLCHTYNETTKTFIDFGNVLIDELIPAEIKIIYPTTHWQIKISDFDAYDISILNQYGVLEAYKDLLIQNGLDPESSRYKYLNYLGDNRLDIYNCRKAEKFALMYVPTVDNDTVRDKFIDKYTINRDYILRTVYSDAYKFESDYYDKFIIIFILITTVMDMLIDIQDMLINREVFDARCIKYLFEAYGVPFYSEIPVKYQQAMLKNLNTLIKYKSSTRNMVDICNLFGFHDINVFEYYMFKQRDIDPSTGSFIFNDKTYVDYKPEDLYVKDPGGKYPDADGIHYTKLSEYIDKDKFYITINVKNKDGSVSKKKIINNDADLYVREGLLLRYHPIKSLQHFNNLENTEPATIKFIKVPIGEDVTNYKNDNNYIVTYDEVTSGDDTWIGDDSREAVLKDITDYEFNLARSKYISVETVTAISEMAFQVSYFYNMLFDNLYSEDLLTIDIPFIKNGHSFRFTDVICYLFAMMYLYNGLSDNIMYSPTQMLYASGIPTSDAEHAVLEGALEFDINKAIAEEDYNYMNAFSDKKMRAFNLNADIDALDIWLYDNYGIELSDIVVSDDGERRLTLRDFYTLKNSAYQKDIFVDNGLYPKPYNQDITYSFDYELYPIIKVDDINSNNIHKYVAEQDYTMEILETIEDGMFIIDNKTSAVIDGVPHSLYRKFTKFSNTQYTTKKTEYYAYTDGEYNYIGNGNILIRDKSDRIIFSDDEFYTKVSNQYIPITDSKYFEKDTYNSKKKLLDFGKYYIKSGDNWVLDPTNCYVLVKQNGTWSYILKTEADKIETETISLDSCYVLHSDGHFIPFVDTDFFRNIGDDLYEYNEEDMYVITNTKTQYTDPDNPGVFYDKLSNYYANQNQISADSLYVKNSSGEYIAESTLINPNNLYYNSGGIYKLVVDNLIEYVTTNTVSNCKYILCIMGEDTTTYTKFYYSESFAEYTVEDDTVHTYIKNSNDQFLIVINNNAGASYSTNKSFLTIFNKEVSGESKLLSYSAIYNAEEQDGVWDENDWYYTGKSYDDTIIKMHGENKWYYDTGITPDEIEEDVEIGSGFYISPESYLGDISIDPGEDYYFSCDIETNFNGTLQVSCEADSSVTSSASRSYTVLINQKQHVSQTFKANNNTTPRLLFLIYDYKTNPIHEGNYVIVSNIRFVKAYNANYIAQDIPSYEMLQQIYNTNDAIYKYLTALMNNTSDYNKYKMYESIYNALMLSSYNKEIFNLDNGTYAKTYTDFLQSRDTVLYDKLIYFKSLDEDTMRKEIANNIIEVCYAVDDCVDTYSYGYLYSYFPAVSSAYIQQYISKIINFFKSWKVHLLGINTVYRFDSKFDTAVRILEAKQLKNKLVEECKVAVHDVVHINPLYSNGADGKPYNNRFDLVEYSHILKDHVSPIDRITWIPDSPDIIGLGTRYIDSDLPYIDITDFKEE